MMRLGSVRRLGLELPEDAPRREDAVRQHGGDGDDEDEQREQRESVGVRVYARVDVDAYEHAVCVPKLELKLEPILASQPEPWPRALDLGSPLGVDLRRQLAPARSFQVDCWSYPDSPRP